MESAIVKGKLQAVLLVDGLGDAFAYVGKFG
jgi:hypothetical protein